MRPSIYQKEVQRLKEFSTRNEWTVTGLYVDKSLKRSEHPEFDRFLTEAGLYDILVVKDFYHLSRNTMACMNILKDLRNQGIEVHSIKNGFFADKALPADKPLRAATYISHCKGRKDAGKTFSLQEEIFTLFAEKKTAWTISENYKDELMTQRISEQNQFKQLITDRDKYDILLVANLNDINWRTAAFCHLREALALDIYSLHDGYLPYRKD